MALENEPSAQGNGALEPSTQNEPGVQATHAVAFADGCRVPAAHGWHVSARASLAYVPGLHGAGSRPPLGAVNKPHALINANASATLASSARSSGELKSAHKPSSSRSTGAPPPPMVLGST